MFCELEAARPDNMIVPVYCLKKAITLTQLENDRRHVVKFQFPANLSSMVSERFRDELTSFKKKSRSSSVQEERRRSSLSEDPCCNFESKRDLCSPAQARVGHNSCSAAVTLFDFTLRILAASVQDRDRLIVSQAVHAFFSVRETIRVAFHEGILILEGNPNADKFALLGSKYQRCHQSGIRRLY